MVGLVGALFAAAITLVTPITRASSLTIPQPSPRAQTVVVRSSDNDLALEIDEQSGAVVSISVGTTTVPVSSSSLNLTVVGGDWTFLSSGPTTGGGFVVPSNDVRFAFVVGLPLHFFSAEPTRARLQQPPVSMTLSLSRPR